MKIISSRHTSGYWPLILNIAKGVGYLANFCPFHGVNQVFILLCQKSLYSDNQPKRINFSFKLIVEDNSFIFSNSDNIFPVDIWKDGLHLSNNKKF